ncbi:MAG: ankyrin repeat domain-containing protein [Planctomycetota bacterium]|nr:ankyrin repeat domain-containing protein [Planctomycetota bacterium]
MTTPPAGAPRPLPDRPDLKHLKDQAKDLQRSGAAPTLAKAQFQIAQSYGFASWPKLKRHVESLRLAGQLKESIDADDLPRVQALLTEHPELHRAPLGYGKNGPLTWVAECRGKPGATEVRLAMARWMLDHGSDVHQGQDGPLMRAALNDARIPMLELLVAHGADVNARWNGNYPIVLGPCETLAPKALAWLLERGASLDAVSPAYGNPLAMLLCTYARHATGKQACLEVLAAHGMAMPDTPMLALHRGRMDLLEAHLQREPAALNRLFSEAEIFPPELGVKPGDGLCLTPMDGITLLHAAVEFHDEAAAAWLLERGADPNARSAVNAEGFGGYTPLFHTVVTMGAHTPALAQRLLAHGADPALKGSVRKQLRDMGDPELERPREWRDVTARAYAESYHVSRWINRPACELLPG